MPTFLESYASEPTATFSTGSQPYTQSAPDSVSDLAVSEQLEQLYMDIGSEVGLPSVFVKTMHLIAGGSAVYTDTSPDIFLDTTSGVAPFAIDGVFQLYTKCSSYSKLPYDSLEIDRKHYLPDAAYNVMSTIRYLMDMRYQVDRGSHQQTFNSLTTTTRQRILFYEAILQYLGYGEGEVSNLLQAYETILELKETDEYVVEVTDAGRYVIKDKFASVLSSYGVPTIEALAIALSLDSDLASSDTATSILSSVPLPYTPNSNRRSDMLLAAVSLVGKARYVWGGGHGVVNDIDGINPLWQEFCASYSDSESGCIQPSGTVCPLHGTVRGACSLSDTLVSDVDSFLDTRTGFYSTDTVGIFADLFSEWHGIPTEAHRLEGLDCSGYVSWIYNQLSTRHYDSTAQNFVYSGGLDHLAFGSELLPCDVIAWGEHICFVLGRTDDTGKVYLQTESTPDTVRFGVAYYSGATADQLTYAKALARKANQLFGNQDTIGGVYNLDSLRYIVTLASEGTALQDKGIALQDTHSQGTALPSTEPTEYTQQGDGTPDSSSDQAQGIQEPVAGLDNTPDYIETEILSLGRLQHEYSDEFEIVQGFNKPIRAMTAEEVLCFLCDSLPIYYISGLATYGDEATFLER